MNHARADALETPARAVTRAFAHMRRYLLALATFIIALCHMLWPHRVQLDWPTITLLAISISVLGAPELSKLLPFIKRVKLGQAEVELQETVQKLHKDTLEAEEKGFTELVSHRPGEPTRTTYNYAFARRPEDMESILDLASRDKEAAIVRIATEIEWELVRLGRDATAKLGFEPPRTIRGLVNNLESKGVLSKATAKAIIEFRNVRNKVIHPAQVGVVSQSILASSIDSGIRILVLLRNIQI